jgi:hypothetical protein
MNWIKQYRKNVKTRVGEVRMMHIAINCWWHPLDVWFVLTGSPTWLPELGKF